MTESTPEISVLHHSRGRLRLRVPPAHRTQIVSVADRLEELPGVIEVRANPRTRTVLVRFDPNENVDRIVAHANDALPLVSVSIVERDTPEAVARAEMLFSSLYRFIVGHLILDPLIFLFLMSEPFGLPTAILGWVFLSVELLIWVWVLAPLFRWLWRTAPQPA